MVLTLLVCNACCYLVLWFPMNLRNSRQHDKCSVSRVCFPSFSLGKVGYFV